MAEENNDKIPAEAGKTLTPPLDVHLRTMIPEKDLEQFGKQLPPEFLSDASEGLGHLKDANQLATVLQQLNQQMHRHLKHKITHKKRRTIEFPNWTYWAIIIIFLLALVGFVLVRMLLRQ
jgi:hypothetical protein